MKPYLHGTHTGTARRALSALLQQFQVERFSFRGLCSLPHPSAGVSQRIYKHTKLIYILQSKASLPNKRKGQTKP